MIVTKKLRESLPKTVTPCLLPNSSDWFFVVWGTVTSSKSWNKSLSSKCMMHLHLITHDDWLKKSQSTLLHHSHHLHVVPSAWISQALSRHLLYRPLLLVGLQGYILYRYRDVVCRFKLIVPPLLVHVMGSTGVRHLWVSPYFSSSDLHIWFV